EETVTRNNLEAAEEIVRQLRLRDIGGIIVIDFIDMILESNRDLVARRLTECLGRDRTKHQVAEITSLGLLQLTRKRISQGLLEAFSEPCPHCNGRGLIVHSEPVPEKLRPEPREDRPPAKPRVPTPKEIAAAAKAAAGANGDEPTVATEPAADAVEPRADAAGGDAAEADGAAPDDTPAKKPARRRRKPKAELATVGSPE
ncbi:MAG: ribonuclease E/G, partial [Mycobacteriales bacterium]